MPKEATATPAPIKTLRSVLIELGLLSPEQAVLLPQTWTNSAIEQAVTTRGLVSPTDVLRAYATLYDVPYVTLQVDQIDPAIVQLIPEVIARRYDLVAYGRDDAFLYVAMATPGRLQDSVKGGLLHKIQDQLKLKIVPAFAPVEQIRSLFTHYGQRPAATLPSVSLLSKTIDPAVLQKVPIEIAQAYQFVAFAQPSEGVLQLAVVHPENPELQQLFQFLQERNNITVEIFQLPEAEWQQALARYTNPNPPVIPAAQTSGLPATPVVTPVAVTEAVPTIQAATVSPAEATPAAMPVVTTLPSEQVTQPRKLAIVTDKGVVSPTTTTVTASPVPSLTSQDIAKQAPLDLTAQHNRDLFTSPVLPDSHSAVTANDADLEKQLTQPVTSVKDLVTIAKSGNVPQFISALLMLAIMMRASDIHIEATKAEVRIRYRIDGELDDVLLLPHEMLASIVSRIKILSELKIDENRVPQDGRFDVRFAKRDIDLRVSTMPTVHGEKVVLRILDKTTGIMSLQDMGIDGISLQRLHENSKKPYGVVLATGPTGSGKSTTLYAILQEISTPEVNIITLEDPVEYEMPGVNQTQIKPKIGFTFAEGLRSILRQDPNVIMVGEIRDAETAEMMTHAALTGHLVLSTLHTNNAAGAIPRLINMGVEPFLITSSMNAIVGQRLVRRVCQDCKQEIRIPQDVVEEITQELREAAIPYQYKDPSNWHFYRGKGCSKCHNGYRGRIGLFEVLTMSQAIESLAIKKAPDSEIEQQAIKEGMITIKQDGLLKAIRGLTTVEEVMKASAE